MRITPYLLIGFLALSSSLFAQENKSEIILSSEVITDIKTKNLDSRLSGISGTIKYNDNIIAHNDHYPSNLYILDSNSKIIDSIITNLNFDDLEDITQDDKFIYLGDFGNNAKGNRQDLKIYRIDKSSIKKSKLKIDTIFFTYSNQNDFKVSRYSNWTDFDCEAMVSIDSYLVLFSKQWLSYGTSIYFLPKTPGNHIAELKKNLDMVGLITGATYIKETNDVYLVGYSNLLMPFVLRIYDIKDKEFSEFKTSKFSLPLVAHQVESITHISDYKFLISNEYISKFIITIPQKTHIIDLENIISPKTSE